MIDILERSAQQAGRCDLWVVQALRDVGASDIIIFRHYHAIIQAAVLALKPLLHPYILTTSFSFLCRIRSGRKAVDSFI